MSQIDIKKYLAEYNGKSLNFMEVCGTHTAAISESGIPSMLSSSIHLISGPGCPVCVTVTDYIDKLCQLSLEKSTCVATFGDMIRVPGSEKALKDVKAQGANIKMVYSPFEMLNLAKAEPNTTFVFAAVGFETTTPVYAVLIERAISENIKNIKLLTALKTMPAVIDKLCLENNNIDGFIAPGHVAAITGSNVFENLAKKHNMPFVVSSFKGDELLASIYALTVLAGKGECKNFYKSVVSPKGNLKAQELVLKYFEPSDAPWRGMGIIPNSGMTLKEEYKEFDAGSKGLLNDVGSAKGCFCEKIIIGKIKPYQCPLFGKDCTPSNPKGACMVSGEGSCHNYYINNRKD